ncbi:MAG: DUF1232 domain-containing protein [bacterium]|jgi:uncharacterized membrane protein YkvA (DUF1232 family)
MLEKAVKYVVLVPKLVVSFAYAMGSPEVGTFLKVAAAAGISYFFTPLDLVPDFFTGIGLLDDLIFALLIMQSFLAAVPSKVADPIFEKVGTNRDEMKFDVEAAVKDLSVAARVLWYAISAASEKLVEYFSRKDDVKLTIGDLGAGVLLKGAAGTVETETASEVEDSAEPNNADATESADLGLK